MIYPCFWTNYLSHSHSHSHSYNHNYNCNCNHSYVFLVFSPVFWAFTECIIFPFFYITLIVSFIHLFTNGIIVNCVYTVHEGLIFIAQEGQVAW